MKGKNFPWKIVIACMLIQGGAMGVVANTMGILFSAIIRDLGFRAGDLSLYYLIRSIVSALTVTTTTRWFFKKNPKVVLGILGSMYTLSVAAIAMFSHLWQWYISAVINGIGMSCMMVILTIILNNWFASNNGTVIGVTLSSSGVMGALFSPVLSRCITAFGWRLSAVIVGIVSFCMIVLPAVFMLTPTPEEEGKVPFGETGEKKVIEKQVIKNVPGYIFFVCLLAIGGTGSLAQFNQQLPTFAQSLGYTLAVGAALTSCSMIGNLSGKVILGVLIDKLGVYRAAILLSSLIGLSFVLFFVGSANPYLLYAAGVCYGTCYSVGGVLMSILLLNIYGAKTYRDQVSRMSALNAFIAAFIGSAFPYIYDLSGSWNPVLIIGFLICATAVVIYIWLSRQKFETVTD